MAFFDELETRSADAREADQIMALKAQLARAGIEAEIDDLADLAALPVLRKSELSERQKAQPPFGGMPCRTWCISFSRLDRSTSLAESVTIGGGSDGS